MQEKRHGKAFSKDEALHANKLLGLIHTNVWGLTKTPPFGEERYFLSFTNELFGKSFIYIVKSEEKRFSKFKDFQAFVGNQTKEK